MDRTRHGPELYDFSGTTSIITKTAGRPPQQSTTLLLLHQVQAEQRKSTKMFKQNTKEDTNNQLGNYQGHDHSFSQTQHKAKQRKEYSNSNAGDYRRGANQTKSN